MRKVLGCSLVLAMCVIIMGAYTRLSDAGLSCPDWPHCYGFNTVTEAMEHQSSAEALYPERPLEPHKAWLEMIHRYIAGTLGLLVIGMALFTLWRSQSFEWIPAILIALVGLQVLLGMWTVTLNLMPLVVTGHLLGGFSLFSLLWLWFLSQKESIAQHEKYQYRHMKPYAFSALLMLVMQILLGGWMASNYAATACTELPFCQGAWWQSFQFGDALFGFLGQYEDYEFGVLNYDARMSIHVMHRFGAILASSLLALLAWRLLRDCSSNRALKYAAWTMLTLLIVQVMLGLSHIVFYFPVMVGVAHNAVAALLLLSCLFIVFNLVDIKGKTDNAQSICS